MPIPKPNRTTRIILAIVGASLTHCAFADGATPIVLAGFFLLIFANAFIGIAEGTFGARIFKLPYTRCIWAMIVANYASFLAGFAPFFLLRDYLDSAGNPLAALRTYTVVTLAVTFLLTLIVEWPFCWLAAKGSSNNRWRVATRFDLTVNAISYLIIILPLYCLASYASIQTRTSIQPNLSFLNGNKAWVYYLIPSGKEVWRIHLDGTEPEKYVTVPNPDSDQRLFVEAGHPTGTWDLFIGHERHPLEYTSTTLVQNFSKSTTGTQSNGGMLYYPVQGGPINSGNFMSFGYATDLRPPGQRDLEVLAWFYAHDGISVGPNGSFEEKDLTRYSLETPFAEWRARSPSILPGNIIVWQLGPQIAVLDATTRKLGFLVKGSSPVVALSDN